MTHHSISIRDAEPQDAAAIATIYNQAINRGNATMDTREKSTEEMAFKIRNLKKREILLVLERAQIILGWGLIKGYSARAGYRTTCETSVYIRHGHFRKGFGTRLKRAMIHRCRKLGYHHLVSKILAQNEASVACNQRIGFEIVGRQNEVGFKKGQWHDVIIMQLVLKEVPPLPEPQFSQGT